MLFARSPTLNLNRIVEHVLTWLSLLVLSEAALSCPLQCAWISAGTSSHRRATPSSAMAIPAAAPPTPATHAILTVLEAGDTVYQADKLPEAL